MRGVKEEGMRKYSGEKGVIGGMEEKERDEERRG